MSLFVLESPKAPSRMLSVQIVEPRFTSRYTYDHIIRIELIPVCIRIPDKGKSPLFYDVAHIKRAHLPEAAVRGGDDQIVKESLRLSLHIGDPSLIHIGRVRFTRPRKLRLHIQIDPPVSARDRPAVLPTHGHKECLASHDMLQVAMGAIA